MISLRKKLPIFYSALMLTGVNLLLRLVGTSFQVYLSSRIGAEGIGLLQLTLSVGGMAMVAGTAGIRTGTMYLTAEEIGRGKPENVTWVLAGSIRYSLVCSAVVAGIVYFGAPFIATKWIRNENVISSIRLYAAFLPMSCLCGVMVGYFTGASRIGTLAAVEVAEQLVCMIATILLLTLWAGHDSGKSCLSVVFGSGIGTFLTLLCLIVLRIREKPPTGPRIPIARRLMDTAAPLAVADDLRTGISTVENLMVPRRLALYPGSLKPLAAFGTVTGMVFPVLMFPAAFLFGLTELLIPELARCNAAGSVTRIRYLVRNSLRIALLYGCVCGGILFLVAKPLCTGLYGSVEAGTYLQWFAPLAILLYCDAVTDAMIKGLGQQKASVRYNITTNIMDVAFLYFLLPRFGIFGYFLSFLVTHVINYILSIRRLLKISGIRVPVMVPLLTGVGTITAVFGAGFVSQPVQRAFAFLLLFLCLLILLGVLNKDDILWLKGLLQKK